METFEHRYSTVLVIAQHGPDEGKPFFGFVNLKTTWAEWEDKLHYRVARFAAIDQGCAPEPIVCHDLEDLPEVMRRGLATIRPDEQALLLAFEALPSHYDRARQLAGAMPHDNAAKESAVTRITTRTRTYEYDTHAVVTGPDLADALRRAADIIEGLTDPHAAKILLATEFVTDEQGKQVPIYGVRIEYEPSE